MRMMLREALEEDGYTRRGGGRRTRGHRAREAGRGRSGDLRRQDAGPRRPGHAARDQGGRALAARHHDHRVRLDRHRDPRGQAGRVRLHHQAVRDRRADPVGAEGARRARAALRGGAAARRGRAQLPVRQHHRQVGGDAGDVRADPAAVGLDGVGADHRRVRDRQGAGRRALHFNCTRRERPFVAVNCAAIPDTLLESELFGYKRGAFTDARTDRAGLFVEADGGTIFLDEIGELSPALQAKLLRVLQEGEIRPLGAARSQKVDVRVIAATNQDLEENLTSGAFREDLFYRLNVHPHPPAAAARPRRRHPAAGGALPRAAAPARRARTCAAFHETAKKALLGYGWPGNVRELENVVERAVALVEGPLIRVDDLPPLAPVGASGGRPRAKAQGRDGPVRRRAGARADAGRAGA